MVVEVENKHKKPGAVEALFVANALAPVVKILKYRPARPLPIPPATEDV
jgi:hypothetical protein